MATAAIVLSIAGGVAEVAGLGLVVKSIVTDRAEARRLFQPRPRPSRGKRSYPPRQFPRTTFGMTSIYREGQQIQELFKYAAKIDAAAYNALLEMRKTLDQDLDKASETLHEQLFAGDDALREHLRYILAGSITERAWGAGCLGTGIVLATVGSVLGTLA